MKTLTVTLFLLVGLAVSASARQFTDDQGRQIEAELIGVNGSNVVLERGGQAAQWPIEKLSPKDQAYVKVWLKDPPSAPKVRVNVWEREGIGETGRFEAKNAGPQMPKNIPMLKSTEEKEKYGYYDIDLSNLSNVDALDVHLSYVVYVIDASNQVIDFTAGKKIERIPAGERVSEVSLAATSVRAKTTSLTLGTGMLGNLTAGTNTDRTKERFGGIWARVYGPDGELLGERKMLHDELERLDFQFTGSTGSEFAELPILESFEKLQELLDKLPPLPKGLPKPPEGLPEALKGLPRPPFGKP